MNNIKLYERFATLEFRLAKLTKEILNGYKDVEFSCIEISHEDTIVIDNVIKLSNYFFNENKLDFVNFTPDSIIDYSLELYPEYYNNFQNDVLLQNSFNDLLNLFAGDQEKLKNLLINAYRIYTEFIFKMVYIENSDELSNFLRYNQNNLPLYYFEEIIDNNEVIFKTFESHYYRLFNIKEIIINYEENNWFTNLDTLIQKLNKDRNLDATLNECQLSTEVEAIMTFLFDDIKFSDFGLFKVILMLDTFMHQNINYIFSTIKTNNLSENEYKLLKYKLHKLINLLPSFRQKKEKVFLFLGNDKEKLIDFLNPFFDFYFEKFTNQQLIIFCNKILICNSQEEVLASL
ncbi:hypothetical protein OBK14_09355 [Empedobacter falsenii]